MNLTRSILRCGRDCGWLPSLMFAIILAVLAHPAMAQDRCEAAEHGMRPDGSDNTAALSRTLAECAGRIIHVPSGTYVLAPNGFAVGVNVPAGTTLLGDGAEGPQATIFRVGPQGTFQALLWIRNASNVSIHAIDFEGTPYQSGCTRRLDYGHAIYVQSDAGQALGVENVDISNNRFRDFNGQSWLTISAAEASPGIGLNSSITVRNNTFVSDASLSGSCAAGGSMADTAAMIALHGSDKSAQGTVRNVAITSNSLNAGYVKEGIEVWSGTMNINIAGNSIADTGLRLPWRPGTELGRYAILIYDSAHEQPGLHPNSIRITGNTIANPVSCGVYVAVGGNLEITANRISGQRDRFDGTLPKGAIALNHAEGVVYVRDNELTGNYIAVSSVASPLNMGTNRIDVPPGGVATKIQ
jgi:Right handed beta helix region